MARCLLHAKETFVVVIREIFCDFVTRETFGETCRIPARLERKKGAGIISETRLL
jgi:hypothetical protein